MRTEVPAFFATSRASMAVIRAWAGSDGVAGGVLLEDHETRVARLRIRAGTPDSTIAVLLTVTDDGDPALTRYGRVWIHWDAPPQEGGAPGLDDGEDQTGQAHADRAR